MSGLLDITIWKLSNLYWILIYPPTRTPYALECNYAWWVQMIGWPLLIGNARMSDLESPSNINPGNGLHRNQQGLLHLAQYHRTLKYMPPENGSCISHSSWSIGRLFFFLISRHCMLVETFLFRIRSAHLRCIVHWEEGENCLADDEF